MRLRWTRMGLLGCWLALAWTAAAQLSSMQTVSGFRVPEYDEQNRLKSQVFGDFAKIREDGAIEITQLKLEFYSAGVLDLTATAPACIYRQKDQEAEAASDIRIARDNMVVTGVGFKWNGREEKFEIHNKARVVLTGLRKRMVTGSEQE